MLPVVNIHIFGHVFVDITFFVLTISNSHDVKSILSCFPALQQLTKDILDVFEFERQGGLCHTHTINPVSGCCLCKEKENIFKVIPLVLANNVVAKFQHYCQLSDISYQLLNLFTVLTDLMKVCHSPISIIYILSTDYIMLSMVCIHKVMCDIELRSWKVMIILRKLQMFQVSGTEMQYLMVQHFCRIFLLLVVTNPLQSGILLCGSIILVIVLGAQ